MVVLVAIASAIAFGWDFGITVTILLLFFSSLDITVNGTPKRFSNSFYFLAVLPVHLLVLPSSAFDVWVQEQ